MRLLAETTETVKDCQRIAGLAERMFRYYELYRPKDRLSPIEQKTVVIGSLFSDIGKTGLMHEFDLRMVKLFAAEIRRIDRMRIDQDGKIGRAHV